MPTLKKAYVEVYELLEANQDKKVKSILPEVTALMTAKSAGGGVSKHLKDVDGNTVAIQCYYFKRWMPVIGTKAVEFGAKASTATGFNTMCKVGVSLWTLQNSTAKKAHSMLLDDLEAGKLSVSDIPAEKKAIAELRTKIEPTDMGFETQEEVIDYLASIGVTVAQ